MKVVALSEIYKKKKLRFVSGLQANGDSFCLFPYAKYPEHEADCYFQFNIYNPYLTYDLQTELAYKHVLASGKPYLVYEEGAFRQFPEFRKIGWFNYKNNVGVFHKSGEQDSTRWKKFVKRTGLQIPDWHSPGSNILIMGQVEYDSALIELYDFGYDSFVNYILKKVREIREYTDRPIVIRPHPKTIDSFNNKMKTVSDLKNITISENFSNDARLSGGKGLQEDLNNAYCVVTYNSNSGVEAVSQGIPTFALSNTSPMYEIAHTDISMIENLNYSIDISSWCNKISYTLWTPTEVKSGEMWAYYKDILETVIEKENNK